MKLRLLLFGLAGFLLPLAADDVEANRLYAQGHELYTSADYRKAVDVFEEAEIQADSPVIRANCVLAQIAAWRMCDMPYKEFKAIEKLLKKYPEFGDYSELIRREYELGDEFYAGKREPLYWGLRWIPWLNGPDKSPEIYLAALDHAPFDAKAPSARLRLAYLLDDLGKSEESVAQLRIIVRDFPNAPAHRVALLALANGLFILAERGDGDGRYITEAHEVLQQYLARYPKGPEQDWARRKVLQFKDVQAQRLMDNANFYRRNGRYDAVKRYLAQILVNYPESAAAAEAERMLVELDENFVPGDFLPEAGNRKPLLKAHPIPSEAARILISPGEREDKHFLVPVPDLTGELVRPLLPKKENPKNEEPTKP